MDPSQVVSSGATYLATLTPQVVSGGIIASGLNGYEYVYSPNSYTFDLWYHAQNSLGGNGAANLNIFQLNGSFAPTTVTGGLTKRGGKTIIK